MQLLFGGGGRSFHPCRYTPLELYCTFEIEKDILHWLLQVGLHLIIVINHLVYKKKWKKCEKCSSKLTSSNHFWGPTNSLNLNFWLNIMNDKEKALKDIEQAGTSKCFAWKVTEMIDYENRDKHRLSFNGQMGQVETGFESVSQLVHWEKINCQLFWQSIVSVIYQANVLTLCGSSCIAVSIMTLKLWVLNCWWS